MEKILDFKKFLDEKFIDAFLVNTSPYNRAEMLKPYFKSVCFIKNDILYIMLKNKTYEGDRAIERNLLTIVSKFFSRSIENLTAENRLELQKVHKDKMINLQNNTTIKSFLPQLITMLTNNDIVLDTTIGELHFENGFINTTTGEFHERTENHFITKYIKRDYFQSTAEDRQKMMKLYNQIYPNETDRDLVLGNIGISLSWKAPQNQNSLFLIGTGSAGKSFVLETIMNAIGPYFQKLKNDTLSNEKDMNKVLNTLQDNPQTLIIWINELEDKKMNSSVYKDLCDGYVQTTRLYQDGNNGFKHFGYVVGTSNKLPNMTPDTGTKRRIVGYTHTSTFVDKMEDVDESKNIYLKDEELHQKIEPLYNAVIDIFVSYCVQWIKDKNIYDTTKSENFQSSIDLINSSNDYMQDFIDSRLIITKNPEDKIGKDRMRELFLQMYPEKHISSLQVISALKDHKLVYDKGVRDKNIRGCFICVKERTEQVDEVDPLSGEAQKDENEIKIEQQAKQIEELLQKLKQLEEDNEKLKSAVKMKTVLETEPIPIVSKPVEVIESMSEELSTASEDEPEPEEEPELIEPPKKLKTVRTKKDVKKLSAFNEEAKRFSKTFKSTKEQYEPTEINEDESNMIANVFFE
jgi:phage/plasmid-associated DNA primase